MPTKIETSLSGELQKTVQELARPIEFAELEASGVLTKAGAWYRVNRVQDLPVHASRKIVELAQDKNGLKVKFEKASKYERLAKKLGV